MKLLAGVIVVASAQSGDADSGVARQRALVSEAALDQAALDAVAADPADDEYEYYYVYEDDSNGIARTRGKKTKKKRKKVPAGSRPAAQAAAQASNFVRPKPSGFVRPTPPPTTTQPPTEPPTEPPTTVGFFNDYANNRNNGFEAFDSFNYNYNTDVFAGLDSDVNSLDLTIANNGKIGVINAEADFVDTQNWAFQHSLWGHAQDTRRTIAKDKPARLFSYGTSANTPSFDVTNNHVARAETTRSNEAKFGKTWDEAIGGSTAYPYNAKWYSFNTENTVPVTATDVNFGYKYADSSAFTNSWMTTLNHLDMGDFDSSWELGSPRTGLQSDQRWFNGIDAGRNAGGSVHGDLSRVKCFKCEVQYGLKWDSANRKFAITGNQGGADIWADCASSGAADSLCEFSSGVCFVEERRLFGYTTLVRKGCKQAQACYKNKAQNFLVQAGRQCWPGDPRTTVALVASRPRDVMADEWIWNLVQGGTTQAGFGQEAGLPTDLTSHFDDSFTDSDGLTTGFYRAPTANLYDDYKPRTYDANGQVFQSWCYQCCNSGNNCNQAWKPETETDWAANWLWTGSATVPANDQP